MKKLLLPALGVLFFIALGFVLVQNTDQEASQSIAQISSISDAPKKEGRPYLDHLYDMHANQETGTIDRDIVRKQLAAVRDFQPAQRALENPIDWELLGPNNVGGRTRTLVYDIDDVNTLYAGMVSGGVFKSVDNGLNWTVCFEAARQGVTAVSAMTMDANGTLWVGTGSDYETTAEKHAFHPQTGSAFPGSGLWKSTDRGETFVLDNTLFVTINEMTSQVVGGVNVVYAATGSGLFMKIGDADWAKAQMTDGGTAGSLRCDGVGLSTGTVVYAMNGAKVMRSENGLEFTELEYDGLANPSLGGRRILGTTEASADVVYVANTNASTCTDRIVRSTDAGVTWEVIGQNSALFDPATGGTQCQGFYDYCIDVDPNNADRIYLGGVTLWRWDFELGWDQVDSYAGDPTSGKYVHPDKQGLFYHPTDSKKLFCTTDGAMFYTENADELFPFWVERVKGYETFQCNSISASHTGTVLAGAQDNGNVLINFSFNSSQTGIEVVGGDGSYTELSNIDNDVAWVSTQNGAIYRTTTAGEGVSCGLDDGDGNTPIADPDPESPCSILGAGFVHPFYMWEDHTLYHKVAHYKPESPLSVEDCNDPENEVLYSYFDPIGGQSFKVTCNDSLLAAQAPLDLISTPKENYTRQTIYVPFDVETQSVDPKEISIRKARIFTSSGNTHLWMAEEAIDASTPIDWKILASGLGSNASAMHCSKQGDMLVVGTYSGRIVKVTGLNNAFGPQVSTYPSGFPFSGRYITDLWVDQANANHVVVTTGQWGNSAHVFESFNFLSANPTFTSIQGELPPMPTYSVVILEGNNTNSGNTGGDLLVGTFQGIWYGEKVAEGQYNWEEQSGDIGRLPVFRLRQEPIARENPDLYTNCSVVYAGVHGRGMWRTDAFTNADVPTEEYDIPTFAVGIEDAPAVANSTMKVYPNPVVDQATIELNITSSDRYAINLFDLNGRLVKSIATQNMNIGTQNVSLNVSDLASGNYIVSLENGKTRETTRIVVAR